MMWCKNKKKIKFVLRGGKHRRCRSRLSGSRRMMGGPTRQGSFGCNGQPMRKSNQSAAVESRARSSVRYLRGESSDTVYTTAAALGDPAIERQREIERASRCDRWAAVRTYGRTT